MIEVRKSHRRNGRFGSKAEVEPPPTLVRSNLNSGHHAPGLRSPESANSGLVRRSEEQLHSITSSAVASSDGGAVLIRTLTIRSQDIKARTQPLGRSQHGTA